VAEATRVAGLSARACDPRRTVVIHNAVDVQAFRPTTFAEGVAEVVGVGRFAYPKDFATLLEALGLVRVPCRLRLAGDGPALGAVTAAITENGLSDRVELLGARADIPELLARADVFVLSSRSEGFPVSVLEAMAAGLPVVATNVGGVAEAVDHGKTGFLVPAGDSQALARAVERLVADPRLRRRLGAAGRSMARALFDVPRYRAAYRELYRRELRVAAAERRRDSAPELNPVNSQLLTSARAGLRGACRAPEEGRLSDRQQHEPETDVQEQEVGAGGRSSGRRGEQLPARRPVGQRPQRSGIRRVR
jgi:hypothetical protein